jgi:A/G-specific adenine glycosylase
LALDVGRLLRAVATPKKILAFQRSLLRWYRLHGRNLPWRRTRDPYAILVSEFMLQQTQVATVIPYYNEWLRRFPDFAALACASENDALRAWQGLGYYARARNFRASAKAIVDRYSGHFPRAIEQMQRLPGIGKYTAHAVASFAFNQSFPIVEANTARVLTRLFNFRESIDSGTAKEALWRYAATLIPRSNVRTYNSALVDLGALVCLPRQPKCKACPVKKFCRAKHPAALPITKPTPRPKRITEKHAFVVKCGHVLLEQSRRRWCGMWILPPLKSGCESAGNSRLSGPVYKAVFPFTNHRVALSVYPQRSGKVNKDSQRWIRIDSLDSIPIPSPHRKAVQHLLNDVSVR